MASLTVLTLPQGHLNRMPIWAAHAGQLAGVMIPYSWILR